MLLLTFSGYRPCGKHLKAWLQLIKKKISSSPFSGFLEQRSRNFFDGDRQDGLCPTRQVCHVAQRQPQAICTEAVFMEQQAAGWICSPGRRPLTLVSGGD